MIIKSENYPDVLAHVSVRARNLNIPFVVCFNESKADNILKNIEKNIEVKLENQEVITSESENKGKKGKNDLNTNVIPNKIKFIDNGNNKYKKIFLELNEFDEDSIGAKSKNT
jgi:formyltetrahydrofolate synthetase